MHDLVGRDRELTTLDEAWRRAMAGDRTVALITGEPGIGKTRLLDELAARVPASGGSLAWGRTAEIGHTPAFWPWLQILSALEVDDDRAPAIGSLEQHPGAASRLALFDATAAFLARRAAT
ncbi:MAG TPA: ATP-binding protein, partial [Kofleriaceae bacterium]|nr:ATP-binding protein [Kofleriaceae bacterium]